ncbi:hypothetical protein CONLIGDRAFT_686742 [Coniochaeta ligniaria NRRL 30616]|uniref:Uncharacterized protein n=1 Tax=Coniochaeta ligniaria NRRL 30616 TaxID=1408157 RepID=A0A1J7J0A8_9PEZI|nr:hypothetical protein CONLIGDRAFT_686742 [Coniochaeta ligniaria NRRL 30616]
MNTVAFFTLPFVFGTYTSAAISDDCPNLAADAQLQSPSALFTSLSAPVGYWFQKRFQNILDKDLPSPNTRDTRPAISSPPIRFAGDILPDLDLELDLTSVSTSSEPRQTAQGREDERIGYGEKGDDDKETCRSHFTIQEAQATKGSRVGKFLALTPQRRRRTKPTERKSSATRRC